MNAQELETAVRLKLDLVVLILRDNAYGMIRWKQENMQFEDYSLEFGNPDFVALAEAHGAHGHRPGTIDELGPTLERAFQAGGVHVVDLAIDYGPSHKLLNEEIPARAAAVK